MAKKNMEVELIGSQMLVVEGKSYIALDTIAKNLQIANDFIGKMYFAISGLGSVLDKFQIFQVSGEMIRTAEYMLPKPTFNLGIGVCFDLGDGMGGVTLTEIPISDQDKSIFNGTLDQIIARFQANEEYQGEIYFVISRKKDVKLDKFQLFQLQDSMAKSVRDMIPSPGFQWKVGACFDVQ